MEDDLIGVAIDPTQHTLLLARYGQLQSLEERQGFLAKLLAIYAGFLEEPETHMTDLIGSVRKAIQLLFSKVFPTGYGCDILMPFLSQVERTADAVKQAFDEYVQEDSFRRKDAVHKVAERLCSWPLYAILESLVLLFVQEYSQEQLAEIYVSSAEDPTELFCRRLFMSLEKVINIFQCSDELIRYSPWHLRSIKLYGLMTARCTKICIPRMLLLMAYKHLVISTKGKEYNEYLFADPTAILSIASSSHLLHDSNYNYTMAFSYLLLVGSYLYADYTVYPLQPEDLDGRFSAVAEKWQVLRPLLLLTFTDFVVLFSTLERTPSYFDPLLSLMISTLESEYPLDKSRKTVLEQLTSIRNGLSKIMVRLTD
ncbi:Hypothetical protein GLP15_112 [Giardia lamblia P15]|uniref:Uncharacterized protein n=1 Tax=Giardia intestinalis (strain P15) TaxID=658858 RepID=E1EX10_GIAIA|nr:Hypothetical protein GLP15_112 [Giardia lamblia P15]